MPTDKRRGKPLLELSTSPHARSFHIEKWDLAEGMDEAWARIRSGRSVVVDLDECSPKLRAAIVCNHVLRALFKNNPEKFDHKRVKPQIIRFAKQHAVEFGLPPDVGKSVLEEIARMV